jgi:hypothetical protein
MNDGKNFPFIKFKYLSFLFLIFFFGLGFIITGILNARITREQQTIKSNAQELSPIQESTCTDKGGECQTGKRNEVGKPCTLSDGVTGGTVIRDLCPSQPNDIRCCVPNDPPIDTNPVNPTEVVMPKVNASLVVRFQGIGPNANIQNKVRTVTLKIFKDDGNFDEAEYTAQDNLIYNQETGNFTNSNFNLGSIPSGKYQVVIQAVKYLDKQLLNSQSNKVVDIDFSSVVQFASVEMRAGDIAPDFRGDNQVNIIDYNALIGCLPGAPPGACLNKDYADLNDDGRVDQLDLDLLLSNFGNNGFSFQTDKFKCEPDPACNSGKDTLQLCSLLCTRTSKRS